MDKDCTCDQRVVDAITSIMRGIREEHPEVKLSDYRMIIRIMQVILYNSVDSFRSGEQQNEFVIQMMGEIIAPFFEDVSNKGVIIHVNVMKLPSEDKDTVH